VRFLVVTQYFWPEVGAAQTRLRAVVSQLTAAGHEVDVVTAMPNYPNGVIDRRYRGHLTIREDDSSGASVRRFWILAAMGTGVRRMLNYGSFTAMSILGLLTAKRPDVVVVESPPLFVALPALWYSRIRRIRSVLNVADLWPDAAVAVGAISEGRTLRLMYRLERWAYRNADVISTVTDPVVERLIAKGVDPDRIIMLPNGVDTDLFRPDRNELVDLTTYGIRDRPFLVYAGTVGLIHGVGPLIEAMAELRADSAMPDLVVLGGGSERQTLERRASELALDNVIFHDPIPIEELAVVLPRAVAGVVTTAPIALNEATRPAKLFPYMASGLPILSIGPGVGAEMVRAAEAGLAVDNDPDEIATAIRLLMNNPVERSQWAENARRWVNPAWSWTGIVSDWLARIPSP
jgi:colanic acid biosynthesis glycosyl transferase WcaI